MKQSKLILLNLILVFILTPTIVRGQDHIIIEKINDLPRITSHGEELLFVTTTDEHKTLGYHGSIDSVAIAYDNNYAQVEGGSYDYYKDGRYYIQLFLDVNFNVEDGYYIEIAICPQDNLVYNWEFYDSNFRYTNDVSYRYNSDGFTRTRFTHNNNYDYEGEAGTIIYRKSLYGGPSANHFIIKLRICSEAGVQKASIIVANILNFDISYFNLGEITFF